MKSKTVLIVGINSDIGGFLSKRYNKDGWIVYGTYRNKHALTNYFVDFEIYCDLYSEESVDDCAGTLHKLNFSWDLVIFASGTMVPIGEFFKVSISEWSDSFHVNFISPLRLLHRIWKIRSPNPKPSVVFFAGGGTNSSFDYYSAYCASKISLIKMTELLDSEYPECNFFSIGPGFVKTKIHKETLIAKDRAGLNYRKTINFQDTPGTAMVDIYLHIQWCMKNALLVSGRNLSTEHDPWRDRKSTLLDSMTKNPNYFKLRRLKE
jgi:NAD(P)-dependent dehydrogenase (short-subunit alcohol dehydrogenase family)